MDLWGLWEQHSFLLHQCFLLPFALSFQYLSGYLSVTSRYIYLSLCGSALAWVTMGVYSLILFVSTFVFSLLVCCVRPERLHPWVFWLQMLWQTFFHLLLQHREDPLSAAVSIRLFTAVSSLMLLTQRVTSLSMDLQEGKIKLPREDSVSRIHFLLSVCSYVLSFPTLLGGPLYPYSQFVGCVEGMGSQLPPLGGVVVPVKVLQVALIEWLRYGLVCCLKTSSPDAWGLAGASLWVWGLALSLRLRYYAHWTISQSLNLAAGFGPQGAPTSGHRSPDGSGFSDGDLWTTEASTRVSAFARRWNATTASWLRRLVFRRCERWPLLMTFGFSAWWHGLYPGQMAGFLSWAVAVKVDYALHRYAGTALTSTWGRWLYAGLSWAHTQTVITCVVLLVESRSLASVRVLSSMSVALFPLLHMALCFCFLLQARIAS